MSTVLAAIVAALIVAANCQTYVTDCGGESSVNVEKSSVSASGTSKDTVNINFDLIFTASSLASAQIFMPSWKPMTYYDIDNTIDICANYIAPCAVQGSVTASGDDYEANGSYSFTSTQFEELPGFFTSLEGNHTVQITVKSGNLEVLCANLHFPLSE